jgi:hypothetical protein
MKLKVVVALVLTLLLLVVARRASMRQQPPIVESTRHGELLLEHNSSHIVKGDDVDGIIPVTINQDSLPTGGKLLFYYRPRVLGEKHGTGAPTAIELQQTGKGRFEAVLANQGRGTEFEYYLQLESASGKPLALIPEGHRSDPTKSLWLRFEGQQSIPLLIAHIAGMFGGLFLAILAAMAALGDLRDAANSIRLGKQLLWTVIIIGLGTFPIGIWIEYQVYGTYWTGIPLGRDITDSKALVVFLAWLTTLILLKGSAFASAPSRNLVGVGGARVATILSLAITLALYLIPHSSGNF